MAKRGAEAQKTKDDENEDVDTDVEPGVRDTPLAPIQGRVIRGLPQRGVVGASASKSTAPPSISPSPFGAGFGFGASANSTPFTFGSSAVSSASTSKSSSLNFSNASTSSTTIPSSAAPPTSSPLSGLSFGATVAAEVDQTRPSVPSPFGVNQTFVSSANRSEEASGGLATTNPFSGFSFSATLPGPVASDPKTVVPPSSKPFGGFSFSSQIASPTDGPTSISAKPVQSTASDNSTDSSAWFANTASSLARGPAPSLPTPPPEQEVSYYSSLRGLNTSFVSFLAQAIESDAFLHLTTCLPGLLSQYERHLDEAASRAGWRPESTKSAVKSDANKDVLANGAVKPFVPPSVGSFALLKAAAPKPDIAGFVPNLSAGPSTSSPFSFSSFAAPKAPEPPVQPSTKTTSAAVTELIDEVMADDLKGPQSPKAPEPSLFATAIPAGTPESKKSASLFSFAPSGPLHKTTPESKSFSPSPNLQAASPPAGLGRFGPGGSTPQLAFGGAKAAAFGAPAAKSSFGFGKPETGFSFGSSPATSSSATSSTPALSFAANPLETFSKGTTPSFAFGTAQPAANAKPTSSTFSFPTTATSDIPQPATTGLSFGSDKSSFAFGTPEETAGPSQGSPANESVEVTPEPVEPSKNLAETDGPGEEEEDTVIEHRGKLYHLEAGNFALAGLGQFKVKRSKPEVKEKRKRRLLLRTDGGGNVVLNMAISKTFNPSVEGSTIRFLGFDLNGKPKTYMLRVKTAQMATDLVEVMRKEVEEIKRE